MRGATYVRGIADDACNTYIKIDWMGGLGAADGKPNAKM